MHRAKYFATLIFALYIAATPIQSNAMLHRVAITGASVSAGYGIKTPPVEGDLAAYPMQFCHIMDAMIVGPHTEVADFCDIMFFRSSRENAREYIQKLKEYEPSLVVGIDFLFWFGYGSVPNEMHAEKYRIERLNFALGLLDELQVQLVIGDIPDVRDAVGKMLSPNQVPSEELLNALNIRIHAWASEKEDVLVLPVHKYWKKIRDDEEILLFDQAWNKDTKPALLQDDMLHMTLEGTVVAGLLVAEALGGNGFEIDAEVIRVKATALARRQ